MKTLLIIQARMGSSRLPGKVLREIKGKPLIVHMLDRLKKCQTVDAILLATSDRPEDLPLIDLARNEGVKSFTGSETDVLDRFFQAAKELTPEHVVRCTGDCPLIDPEVTDLVIKHHLEKNKDYTSNTVTRSYPRGLDTEVMKFAALEKAVHEAKKDYEREHVTPFIWEHPNLFSIEQVVAEPSRQAPEIRLTVDTLEDFNFVQAIFDRLHKKNPAFGVDAILELLRKTPELRKINAHVKQKAMA